eukprot:356816-Chlamydomonas_euryale.AAC.4
MRDTATDQRVHAPARRRNVQTPSRYISRVSLPPHDKAGCAAVWVSLPVGRLKPRWSRVHPPLRFKGLSCNLTKI